MYLFYSVKNNNHISSLWNKDECIGEFRIDGVFDSGNTCSLSIHIDDMYQGKGYSRLLIKNIIEHISKTYTVRPDQLLFIDADASNGFWDHIGMKENRYGYDYVGKLNVEGKGYEKVITWFQLYKFAAYVK